jgi:hypothetical protein
VRRGLPARSACCTCSGRDDVGYDPAMTDPDRAEQAVRRAAELREELAAVTRRSAEVAELSARVHDQVAATHDALPHPDLDPEQLRRHADESRAFAAEERRAAEDLDR